MLVVDVSVVVEDVSGEVSVVLDCVSSVDELVVGVFKLLTVVDEEVEEEVSVEEEVIVEVEVIISVLTKGEEVALSRLSLSWPF